MMKTAALVAACLIAGGFLSRAMTDEPQGTTRIEIVERQAIAPPSANASDTEMAFASPLGRSISQAPATKPNELGMKLMSSKDNKAFVIEALKHPEKGGAFYAHEALRQCGSWEYNKDSADASIKRIVATQSTISSDHLAQIKEIETRCGGLLEDDRDALEQEVYRIAMSGADPLMKLTMTPGPKRVDNIAKSANMALISATNTSWMLMNHQETSDDAGTVTVFNGVTYGPQDYPGVNAGALLGSCIEGDYCKLESERLGACWYRGECFTTIDEFVKHQYLHDDQPQFVIALKIAEQIRSAMSRGDTSIFAKP